VQAVESWYLSLMSMSQSSFYICDNKGDMACHVVSIFCGNPHEH
jgi:hypothetical protein